MYQYISCSNYCSLKDGTTLPHICCQYSECIPNNLSVTASELKAENTSDTHLYIYPVYLLILGINLIAHIQSHVFQIPKNVSNLSKIFIHFIFSGIIGYPVQIIKTCFKNQELAFI